MDFLVNIVITVVIILYVLKRVQEVSKKAGDISGPPPPARMFEEEQPEKAPARRERPPRSSWETTRMPKRMEMPTVRPRPVAHAPQPPPSRTFAAPEEPPPPRKPAVTEVRVPQHRHITVPGETAPSREGRIREVVREDEEGWYADTGARLDSPGPRRKKVAGAKRPVLTFFRNDVVRGIIMSEILGPPVSMRREVSR